MKTTKAREAVKTRDDVNGAPQGRESAHLMSGNGAGATPASATISWLNK